LPREYDTNDGGGCGRSVAQRMVVVVEGCTSEGGG